MTNHSLLPQALVDEIGFCQALRLCNLISTKRPVDIDVSLIQDYLFRVYISSIRELAYNSGFEIFIQPHSSGFPGRNTTTADLIYGIRRIRCSETWEMLYDNPRTNSKMSAHVGGVYASYETTTYYVTA